MNNMVTGKTRDFGAYTDRGVAVVDDMNLELLQYRSTSDYRTTPDYRSDLSGEQR